MAKQDNAPWGHTQLEYGKIKEINIADLNIYVHLLKNEIKVAYLYGSRKNFNNPGKSEPDFLEWKRWPVNKKVTAISFDPVPPERAILVKPESSLNLPGLSESKIFCRFPVSVKLSTVISDKQFELINVPAIKLSNTWFGNFKEGEICYSISSSAKTEIEADEKRPYMAICPIRLKNKTRELFPVDKICLRSDYLTFFLHKKQLWSDEMILTYEGKNEISQVSFSGKPPAQSEGAKLIAKPRQIIKKSFYASSFSTIRDLYGSGLFAGK